MAYRAGTENERNMGRARHERRSEISICESAMSYRAPEEDFTFAQQCVVYLCIKLVCNQISGVYVYVHGFVYFLDGNLIRVSNYSSYSYMYLCVRNFAMGT